MPQVPVTVGGGDGDDGFNKALAQPHLICFSKHRLQDHARWNLFRALIPKVSNATIGFMDPTCLFWCVIITCKALEIPRFCPVLLVENLDEVARGSNKLQSTKQ